MKHRMTRTYLAIDYMKRSEGATYEDLVIELKMKPASARRHLKEMHALDLIYIEYWYRPSANHQVPVYRWGNKEDAPRLRAKTWTEKSRQYRARKKNGPLPLHDGASRAHTSD